MENEKKMPSPDEIIKVYQSLVDEMTGKVESYLWKFDETDPKSILAGRSQEFLAQLRYMHRNDETMKGFSSKLKKIAQLFSEMSDAPELREKFVKMYTEHGFEDISVIEKILVRADKVSEKYKDSYAEFKKFIEEQLPSLDVVVEENMTLHGKYENSFSSEYAAMKRENAEFADDMNARGLKIAEDPWDYS